MSLSYVSFNYDSTSLAVATSRGLRIYSTEPFELTSQAYDGDTQLAEQLFSTSLVAMVTTPRLLKIVNTKVCVCGEKWKRAANVCPWDCLAYHG
jgi:autophagy-related protein 18